MAVFASESKLAKRTKAEARETRETLLDTAATCFCERGVAKTTMDEIARHAGMTRGAIYWHFRDKADLLTALWEQSGSPELAPGDDAIAGLERAGDPLGYLRIRAIKTLKDAARERRTRQVWTLLFQKSEHGSTPLTERMLESRRGCKRGVKALFRDAQARGQVPASLDVGQATFAYFAYLDGVIYDWLLDLDGLDLAANAENLVDVFFRGLA